MSEPPPPPEGHRFETHVAGSPAKPEGSEFTYQYCVRCGAALQVVDGGLNNAEPVEPGTLWSFITGPQYQGYHPTTPQVLAYTTLCVRKDLPSQAK